MSTDRISQAWKFFLPKHKGQKYGDGLDYEYHLRKVYDWLIRVGVTDKDLLMAAPGHDSIEDTPTTVQEIEFALGWKIAALCWAVSDGPGKNRREKKASAYAKINTIPDAVILKLADRLANTQAAFGAALKRDNPKMMTMYLKESQGFHEAMSGAPCSSNQHQLWAYELTSALEAIEAEARKWLRQNI